MVRLNHGLGGKAGRSRYVVQVGEVSNLYKTAKPSSRNSAANADPLPTLDLHGHTKEEAVAALDAALEVWADEAMRGSYPFVREAEIICGCGSQVVSETVAEWIRDNVRVRNAPGAKGRRGCSLRAA